MKTREREPIGKSGSDEEWIYGINPLFEAISSGRRIFRIFLSAGRRERVTEIEREAAKRDIPLSIKEPDFFDRLFHKGHQGVAALVSPLSSLTLFDVLDVPNAKGEIPFFLVLDCIEDPRNFGAIVRVADAAGIHGIVVQSHRSVSLSAQIAKASAGALEYVPIVVVPNIKHALRLFRERDITVVGGDMGADRMVWDAELTVPLALVVGSEGKGMRRTVRELCDLLLRIPMRGRVNSLNVSVATAIFAFEILRQRRKSFEKKGENQS